MDKTMEHEMDAPAIWGYLEDLQGYCCWLAGNEGIEEKMEATILLCWRFYKDYWGPPPTHEQLDNTYTIMMYCP